MLDSYIIVIYRHDYYFNKELFENEVQESYATGNKPNLDPRS
jgi:hypothetical protein